jgi:hypothetical protein
MKLAASSAPRAAAAAAAPRARAIATAPLLVSGGRQQSLHPSSRIGAAAVRTKDHVVVVAPCCSTAASTPSPLGAPPFAAAAAHGRRQNRRAAAAVVASAAAAAGDNSSNDSNNTDNIVRLAAESSAAVEAAARALLFESAALLGDAARGPKSAREAAAAFAERAAAQLASAGGGALAARDPALGAAVRQLAAQFSARAESAALQLVEAAEAGPGGALEGGRARAAIEGLQVALADAAAGIEGAVIGAGARDAGVSIDRFVQQLRAANLATAGRGVGGRASGANAASPLGGIGGAGVTMRSALGVAALWLLVRLLGVRLAAAGWATVPAGPAALVLVPFLMYGAEVIAGPALVSALAAAFAPAVAFCCAWTPLFCVPVVVGTVQVAGSMPPGLLRPLVAVVGACTAATLLIAGRLAAPAPPLSAAPGDKRALAAAYGDAGDDGNLPPVRARAAWAMAWTVAAAAPVGLTAYEAASFGDAAYFATGLAASIAGFLWGRALPRRLRFGLLQPTVLGGLVAAAATIYQGHLCGLYAGESLDLYLSAGAGGVAGAKGVWGAGDVLLALLGAATAAAGFLLHPSGRRAVAAVGAPGVAEEDGGGAAVSRHVALRVAASAAVASVAVTAIASRALGLAPEWARALAVRGSLGSAALPLGDSIGAASACVGAVLLVQSVLGAALAPLLLRWARVAAPSARGAAAGAAAGPLGAAAAADGDARALASGMLGYALASLTTVALFSWPAARALVLRAVG